MSDYQHIEIEKKWKKFWAENQTFKAEDHSDKPKYYVLDMFPYPSGAGLHVGHPLGYIASDVISRYKRHQGFNVLHPMGYDSFGLPAEQYAIQTGQHPAITTENNIARYREQLDNIGFSFDWSREVRTSDPSYYKWTQWIFKQLFNAWYNQAADKAETIESLIAAFEKSGNSEIQAVTSCEEEFSATDWKAFAATQKENVLQQYRLTYLAETMVNWCEELGTVLANDEVKDGKSERGGYPVVQKRMKQWMMRINAYSDRLLKGLEQLDWSDALKEIQRNWIGKSEGASIAFAIEEPHPQPLSKGEGSADAPIAKDAGFMTANKVLYPVLQEKAKKMRSNPTTAELALWEQLRDNQLGSHFRRQHIIGQYIPDFVCLSKKLIIEVDGKIHDYQVDADAGRTYMLNEFGFDVIRFKNEEVIGNIESVTAKIEAELEKRSNITDGATQTPPPSGEAGRGLNIQVFTTRPDTIFGVSFMVLAPEHELVAEITTDAQKAEVDAYVKAAGLKSERDRQAESENITGCNTGAFAIHPFTGNKVPVYIADYVLAGYGTGAVMAVPAGDQRDYNFAKQFNLPIPPIFDGVDISEEANASKDHKIINSDYLNGLTGHEGIKKAITEIEARGLGKGKTNYRLRDAVFSRQRYWGEPFPVYYKDGLPNVMENDQLPVTLPEIDEYLPTKDGQPPLGRAAKEAWNVNVDADQMELNTMPGWAGSSWYFARYCDPNNENEFAAKEKLAYWQNVDLYIGGAEHATGHLLYARFWTKFLFDLGHLPYDEPFKKLINQGMILGRSNFVFRDKDKQYGTFVPKKLWKEYCEKYPSEEFTNIGQRFQKLHVDINLVENDMLELEKFRSMLPEFKDATFYPEGSTTFKCGSEVEKMSKSKLNVQNPDDLVEKFGADTLRCYEMFLGPLEQHKPWDTQGIIGVYNFLKKLWRLFHPENGAISNDAPDKKELKALHTAIKGINEDIERYSFNTVVSKFMICVNELQALNCSKKEILEPLAILLSPYAPHMAEELWELLGYTSSISFAKYPIHNEEYLVEDSFEYPVSFNGKMRFKLELPATLSKDEVEAEVLRNPKTAKYLEDKKPKKVIVVPKKIVNVVL